jgi:hypothetical protein
MQCEAIGGPTPAASMFRWYVEMESDMPPICDQHLMHEAGQTRLCYDSALTYAARSPSERQVHAP